MNAPLVDKMRHIRGMQAAMRGKVIYKDQGDKFVGGGDWEIITTFKGKSHEQGGIDLEVSDGYVRRISGVDDADDIAFSGRFWKDVGAFSYGVLEGTLDTLTMGATDQLTDWGYEKLQDVGGSTEDEKREQDSLRGYGITGGAITGGIVSGGATTGSAIQQGSKGLGMGISKGSPDSKLAQQIGIWLPATGAVVGLIAGNQGYGAPTPGMDKANLSMGINSTASKTKMLSDIARYGNYAQTGYKILSPILNPRKAPDYNIPVTQRGGGMYMGGMGGSSVGEAQQAASGEGGQTPIVLGGKSSSINGESGPQEDLFYAQVPMREETLARLTRYNINV